MLVHAAWRVWLNGVRADDADEAGEIRVAEPFPQAGSRYVEAQSAISPTIGPYFLHDRSSRNVVFQFFAGTVSMDVSSLASQDRPDAFIMTGAVMLLHRRMPAQTMHAHRPFELIVALGGSFLVRASSGAETRHRALTIAPMEPHALVASEGPIARLYIDPASLCIGGLGERMSPVADAPHTSMMDDVAQFYDGNRTVEAARWLMMRWQAKWLPWLEQMPRCDPRVAAALTHLDGQTVPHASRASLAVQVNLSPSRFAALFSYDTGMSLSAYLAWRRVLLAARLIRRGRDLTSAALAAGFADGAHLSRTYRKIFGNAPSWLRTIEIVPPADGRKSGLSALV